MKKNSKFKKLTILALVLLISFSFARKKNSEPITPPELEKKVDELFFKSMEYVRQAEYKKGLETIDEVKALIPNHPAGYLFASAVLQWIVKSYRDYSYDEEFYQNINQTIDLAEDMSRLNSWRYIYIGGAYGFRGIEESELGNFFSAFHDGLRGVNRIKRALELDPTIYDSYYGLGTYIFWKSFYLDQFFFLSGNPNDKDLGIRYNETCIKKCKYTSEVAEQSLIRIYHVDGRYLDAIKLANKILKDAPKSIGILRQLGHSYFDNNQREEALKTYQQAKEYLLEHPLTHDNAIMEINYHIARTLVSLDRFNEAESLYQDTKSNLYPNVTFDIQPMENIADQFDELIKNKKVDDILEN